MENLRKFRVDKAPEMMSTTNNLRKMENLRKFGVDKAPEMMSITNNLRKYQSDGENQS